MAWVLETSRLRLRPFTLEDADALVPLVSDPRVMRFGPGVKTGTAIEQWIQRWIDCYATHGFGQWATVLKGEDRLVGAIGLIPQVVDGVDEVEIGYRLVPQYWGQGLAIEAARGCRDHAFDTLKAERVISIIEPANAPSIRVAERNGMTLEKETTMWDKHVRIYGLDRSNRPDSSTAEG